MFYLLTYFRLKLNFLHFLLFFLTRARLLVLGLVFFVFLCAGILCFVCIFSWCNWLERLVSIICQVGRQTYSFTPGHLFILCLMQLHWRMLHVKILYYFYMLEIQQKGLLSCMLTVYVQQIPADHLEGLYIWKSEDSEPVRTVYAAGRGLPNTDYVMYIQSVYTTTCLEGVSTFRLVVNR